MYFYQMNKDIIITFIIIMIIIIIIIIIIITDLVWTLKIGTCMGQRFANTVS